MEENKTIGIETWGGGSRRTKSRTSKLSLVSSISTLTGAKSLDITTLSITELKQVLVAVKAGKCIEDPIPTGRLKAPYISMLDTLAPTVNFNKLSVQALQELIGAFHV